MKIRTWKPSTGGIPSIVVGALGTIGGIVAVVMGGLVSALRTAYTLCRACQETC